MINKIDVLVVLDYHIQQLLNGISNCAKVNTDEMTKNKRRLLLKWLSYVWSATEPFW